MGTKSNPAPSDCYANALPDEPMFTLLARDPAAPDLIRMWARQRELDVSLGMRPKSDLAVAREAYSCAAAMIDWRIENDGAWRKPTEEYPDNRPTCVRCGMERDHERPDGCRDPACPKEAT